MAEENAGMPWIRVNVSDLAPPEDNTGVPFTLVACRFKSSSPDCEAFIHDPLKVMREAPELQALGLTGDWKVTTLVLNHHETLSATHLHVLAAVAPEDQTIGLTLVKKRNS